jgi:hypothetical protein
MSMTWGVYLINIAKLSFDAIKSEKKSAKELNF